MFLRVEERNNLIRKSPRQSRTGRCTREAEKISRERRRQPSLSEERSPTGSDISFPCHARRAEVAWAATRKGEEEKLMRAKQDAYAAFPNTG